MGSQPNYIHFKKVGKKLARPFILKALMSFVVVIALKFNLFQLREWEVHVSGVQLICTQTGKHPLRTGSLNSANIK